MRTLVLALVVVLACAARSTAQVEPAVHLVWHGEGGASETWAGRVARRLEGEGLHVEEGDAWALARGADRSAAYAALFRVEHGLATARQAVRDFDDAAALVALAEARDDASRALSLPGAVPWAAEVELAIGRVAAQTGQTTLARASFARAFGLTPTRALGAAEATPEVVALAAEVMRDVRAAPAGRFDVSVVWGERAFVYLDDQLLGTAPRRVETRAGAHVLRIEADGAEPYVAWIDVLPGSRPPLAVALSPTATVAALASVRAALAEGDSAVLPARIAALDAALGEPVVVWIVEGRTLPFERALATACDRDVCHVASRLDTASRASPTPALEAGPESPRALREAHAWLAEELPAEPPPPPPTDPWSEGWPWAIVGVGGALVLGGIVAGVVVATQPPPEHQLEIIPTFTP